MLLFLEGNKEMTPNLYNKDVKVKIGVLPAILKGTVLTLVLAVVANQISNLPFFSIMGIMIISILLGMGWKVLMNVPADYSAGITFSSKYLLRAGIILMGVRLDFQQILNTGFSVVLIDCIVIAFTLLVIIYLGKITSVDRDLVALIAVGTAVCGAAAIVAVAPLIKAKKEYTALSVACIAILGTIGTLAYTFLYPVIGLNPEQYGVLVGSTLHELAHVVAAAMPSGEVGSETAIVVKLGRVALLIPVAILLGLFYNKKSEDSVKFSKKKLKDLPIPWFIFGFLAFSLLNTFIALPTSLINFLIIVSVFLMSMAMAGLGLGINFTDFKKAGIKPVIVGVLGFIALAAIGPFLLYLL